MANNNSKNENTNDGLALVVGGLFVLALVFGTYSYFNRSNNEEMGDAKGVTVNNNAINEDQNPSLGDRIRDLFNSRKESEGDLNGMGANTKADSDSENTMSNGDVNGSTTYSYWEANDYTQGDISGNTYEVTSGDTLWEIAEARYGNGADWTKILDANSDSIGYLPSGQQALIVPGQVLVLP